ncbi:MAG: serine protease, partial [Rhizonema sp. PD38]|nr:serine protease [Rhizonema sp. PD38]
SNHKSLQRKLFKLFLRDAFNKIKPGMSGGPLLDEQGRVVGINGIASTDITTGATDFAGIPISTYVKLASIAESFQPKVSITSREIANIAKQVTVLIQSQKPRYGSGVIIKRVGNTYTILTTAHVIDVPDKYEIVTADNQHYQLNYSSVKRLPGVDLAVAEFTSNRIYTVAKIGNSDTAKEGTKIYVSGYPEPSYAINQSIYTVTVGDLTANASKPLRDGYALVYTNETKPGMSGGAVLNNNGELVGIHGRRDVDTETITGFNLGIPINTYVKIR